MNKRRDRRLDRTVAEQLLVGRSEPGHARLHGLLTPVADPPGDSGPRGEEAVTAAFLEARRSVPAKAPRGRPGWAVKVAGLTCATVLLGGGAYAAATGSIGLGPGDGGSPKATGTRGGPSHGISGRSTSRPTQTPATANPIPPVMAGLCRAHLAHPERPADPRLSAAAGGADKIATYCAPAVEPTAPGNNGNGNGQGQGNGHGKPSTPPGKGKPSTPPGKGKPSAPPGKSKNEDKPKGKPSTNPGHAS